jgi:hypothetical protein
VGYSIYNKNVTRTQVVGVDFGRGAFSHSFRFGYLKTVSAITDATRDSGLPFGNYPLDLTMGGTGLVAGPCSFHRTPRSVEMNIGIQQEIRPGMILSADFSAQCADPLLSGDG